MGWVWIVRAEKDIMRLKGLDIPENLVVLSIEFFIDEGFHGESLKTFMPTGWPKKQPTWELGNRRLLGGLDGKVYQCQE